MNYQSVEYPVPALVQESRTQKAPPKFAPGKAPIVPPGSVTGRSLMVVIVIMSFLACLTTGAVYLINQSAAAWLKDVAGEVTVQMAPGPTPEETEQRVAGIARFLSGQIGITRAEVLSKAQSTELVKPWLGEVEALLDMPLPRLIAVEIDRDSPPDLTTLRVVLTNKFEGAVLDDHRGWRTQIRRVTGTLALAGIAVIILVALATIAIIVSATRSAMASNRQIVEVLNFVGAEEKFIARQFELHFLKLGIKAGFAGAVAAAVIFMSMPVVTRLLGGEASQAEIRRLVGTGALDALGYATLLIVVAAVAFICQMTSRYGARQILDAQNR